MAARDTSTIVLFDVDGTLTPARQRASPETEACLQALKKKVVVGLVGGSDLVKINEQMSMGDDDVTKRYDYVFSENGLVAHKNGELIHKQDIAKYMGEDKLQKLINFALNEMSQLTLPSKRGTFVEFRSGMINVCPVGRSCSQAQRDEFAAYDKEHRVREALVAKLRAEFPNDGFVFAIGGQISIDVYPENWDKRYCLQQVEKDQFKTIYFFGDKTSPGGNDHEIFSDPRTLGYTVTSPADTVEQITRLFLS
ncbi:hypothetical protein CAPTEDRAFT_221704 [Capitella teleta]|uniref:Phosphomannomutase n=1 Tax=Capitella teleta TaxID=283909 RepID=R7TKZ9_CAPTE|nr:hypothetical protein CAPTEDRAFT_221704 [Capitella teleta]|eukprot:ELT92236.1 hypothetical protein CAPTEDRAFT_221704 [Capitella teleta]